MNDKCTSNDLDINMFSHSTYCFDECLLMLACVCNDIKCQNSLIDGQNVVQDAVFLFATVTMNYLS